MDCRRRLPGWLGLMAWLATCSAGGGSLVRAESPEHRPTETVAFGWMHGRTAPRPLSWSGLDLDTVPEEYRARVLALLEKPTLQARGPSATFHCQPPTYRWLLDHPDRAVAVWQKLGAEVTPISDRGNGRFGWSDEQGSDMSGRPSSAGNGARVGSAKAWCAPGPCLRL